MNILIIIFNLETKKVYKHTGKARINILKRMVHLIKFNFKNSIIFKKFSMHTFADSPSQYTPMYFRNIKIKFFVVYIV